MKIKCAWCEKIIGTKDFAEDDRIPLVTHTICKSCQKKLLQDEHIKAAAARKRMQSSSLTR